MPAAKDWQSKAQICRDIQRESITKQWMLPQEKLPPKNKHNVTRVPYDGDTMSAKELEMTEQNASGLLRRYENGEWAVEEVTTAFLKRATIGQQLVSCVNRHGKIELTQLCVVELCHRVFDG